MYRIGVMGSTGYMGGEVVKLLLENPNYEVAWLTSRKTGKISDYHRNLIGCDLAFIREEEITDCDAVVLSLPSGMSMEIAPRFIEQGIKVIDLSADYRIKDVDLWEQIYGRKHISPEMISRSVYGIAELHRGEIKKSSLIANPGCFSSSAILGLAPLMKEKNINKDNISIVGLSGSSGVGAELDIVAHHPEAHNNIVAYNVVGHRHTFEIEQELQLLSNEKVSVNFTPAYVPITRGILSICNLNYEGELTLQDVISIYEEFYRGEEFIKILEYKKDSNASWQYKPYPWVTAVAGTNYCHIGMDIDTTRKRIVIFSALDNMGKGGAHVCIQNLNLIFGLEEGSGLRTYASHPC